MAADNGAGPKINLVSLIKRTLGKVFVSIGLQENPATIRMVLTCVLTVAADYVKALGDDPVHAEKLFRAFLVGTPEEIQAAVKAFGEAFAVANEPSKREEACSCPHGILDPKCPLHGETASNG